MTAERDEFLTGGMRPLACRMCGTKVLVKKNSEKHTSIQWTTDAASSCPVFAERVAAGATSALLDTCEHLGESIAHAVSDGTLPHAVSNGTLPHAVSDGTLAVADG